MAQKQISNFFGKSPASKKSTAENQPIQESIPIPTSTSLPALLTLSTSFASEISDKYCSNSPQEPTAPPCDTAANGGGFNTLAAFAKHFQSPNFVFPGWPFGTETFNRAFTPAWFNKWKWLHYVAETDKKLINADNFRADNPFVADDFGN